MLQTWSERVKQQGAMHRGSLKQRRAACNTPSPCPPHHTKGCTTSVRAAQDTLGFRQGLAALGTAQPHHRDRVSCGGRLEEGRSWDGDSDHHQTLILPQKLFESVSSKVFCSLLKKITFSKQFLHIHKHWSLVLVTPASTPFQLLLV